MDRIIKKILVALEIFFAVIALLLTFATSVKFTLDSNSAVYFNCDMYEAIKGVSKHEVNYIDFSIGNLLIVILLYIAVILAVVRPFVKKLANNIVTYVSAGLLLASGLLLFCCAEFTVVGENLVGETWDATVKICAAPVTAAIFLIIAALCVVGEVVVAKIFTLNLSRKKKVKKVTGRR